MTEAEGSRHIHRRLTAFQKLLDHAVAKYSNKEIYIFLKMVTETVLRSRGKQSIGRATNNGFKIRSIMQLRDTVEDLISRRLLNSDASRDQVVMYFDTFLRQLDYLKNLKKYFDTKVFKCLCNYFYDPYDEFELLIRPSNWNTEAFDMTDESLRTQLPAIGHIKLTSQEVQKKSDKEIFSHVVSELCNVDKKWEKLLHEEATNLNDFDPESHEDLIQFADYTPFEPILRLVPDIHAKCRQAIQIANVWIALAKRIYMKIPVQRTVIGETDTKRERIVNERQLSGADDMINRNKNQIGFYYREMENVSLRNIRFAQLSRSLKKIKIRSAKKKTIYRKILSERQTLTQQMHLLKPGSRQDMELREKLAQVDKTISNKLQDMKLIQHEQVLFQGEYVFEEKSQSDLKEYVGCLSNKIKEANMSLEEWQRQKLMLEKKLVLLKTNTEKNRQNLMSAKLETMTMKKSFSRQTKRTVKQLNVDSGFMSDGNFDDDGDTDPDITDLDVMPLPKITTPKQIANRAVVLKDRPSKLPVLQKSGTYVR